MSAFEDFVQLELPKRPYTEDDPNPESVYVRRGPGPRQTVGVTLTAEGHVPVLKGGVVISGLIDDELTCVDGGFY